VQKIPNSTQILNSHTVNGAVIAQSVQLFAMDCKIQVKNPGRSKGLVSPPHPSLLALGSTQPPVLKYRVSPGGTTPGVWRWSISST